MKLFLQKNTVVEGKHIRTKKYRKKEANALQTMEIIT